MTLVDADAYIAREHCQRGEHCWHVPEPIVHGPQPVGLPLDTVPEEVACCWCGRKETLAP